MRRAEERPRRPFADTDMGGGPLTDERTDRMFEKMRIKEHMEVATSEGGHLGTVDEVEDSRIKLTRSDSGDGRHHYVPLDAVDRIDDNRIYLKAGTSATHADGSPHVAAGVGAGTDTGTGASGLAGGGEIDRVTGAPMAPRDTATDRNPGGMGANSGDRIVPGESGRPGVANTAGDQPLFGTSGHGTGMGGSGVGH